MDIITLRVLNTVHKLNISEEEFKDIEREQGEIDHTGIYIATVKKKHAVYVNHDDKHRIMIKKGDFEYPSRILLKTLITFKNVPEQIYILHRIGKYRSQDTVVKHTANNMSELKDRILQRFRDGYPQELGVEGDSDVYDKAEKRRKAKKKRPEEITKQLKALYWLFDEKFEDKEIYSRINVARIIKVWKHKNKRTALFQENQCYRVDRSAMYHNYENIDRVAYKIKTYTPRDKEYNYVCPGREVGLSINGEYIELWIDDDLFEKVNPAELEILQGIGYRDKFWFLKADKMVELQREVRITQTDYRRAKEDEEAKEILEKNIEDQFENGEVKRKGFIFTPDSVSYEGIKVSGDGMKAHIVKKNLIVLEEPNFNQIWEGYIEEILDIHVDTNYYPYDREICFSIGEKRLKVGKVNIIIVGEKGRMNVNGFRVARNEIEEIIKRAINYKTQKAYDKFLEKTSKVSLRLQRALETGFFQFEVDLTGNGDCELSLKEKKMILAIPIVRENNKNYVVVGKEKFSIKNIHSFFRLDKMDSRSMWRYEGSPLQKIVIQLHKAVHKLTPEDISKLISHGINNYRKVVAKQRRLDNIKIKKSKEFLQNAIRLSKAVKIDGGWKVLGISGTIYTVDEKNIGVNKILKDGKEEYLCIVDVETDIDVEWGKNDAIAKRLLMLSKDIKVASEIDVLGDRMDQHWAEI